LNNFDSTSGGGGGGGGSSNNNNNNKNHKVKELQKTAILGTAHILQKVLT